MAEVSDQQIRKAVEQATAAVLSESRGFEGARFQVSDLRGQLDEFVGGKLGTDNAWTISYSTSLTELGSVADRVTGGDQAWTISYSTSRVDVGELDSPAKAVSRRATRG